jgi:hypothetical protein
LIFTRVAPVVAIAEVKAILKVSGSQYVEKARLEYHESPRPSEEGEKQKVSEH